MWILHRKGSRLSVPVPVRSNLGHVISNRVLKKIRFSKNSRQIIKEDHHKPRFFTSLLYQDISFQVMTRGFIYLLQGYYILKKTSSSFLEDGVG